MSSLPPEPLPFSVDLIFWSYERFDEDKLGKYGELFNYRISYFAHTCSVDSAECGLTQRIL
jgi:hypothetical protein